MHTAVTQCLPRQNRLTKPTDQLTAHSTVQLPSFLVQISSLVCGCGLGYKKQKAKLISVRDTRTVQLLAEDSSTETGARKNLQVHKCQNAMHPQQPWQGESQTYPPETEKVTLLW